MSVSSPLLCRFDAEQAKKRIATVRDWQKHQSDARESDDALRLASLDAPPNRKKKERPPSAHWMHGMRTSDVPLQSNPLERLKIYQGHLGSLGNNVHTCLNCLQRAHDHGTRNPARNCWYCAYDTRPLHWTNGLDLNFECAADEATEGRMPKTSDVRCHFQEICRPRCGGVVSAGCGERCRRVSKVGEMSNYFHRYRGLRASSGRSSKTSMAN